jgi:hypothetical protein
MRSLAAVVAQQAPALMRAYAGAAGTVVPASSPFLRFSNPYPTPVELSPLLSTIPETQVRTRPCSRPAGEGSPQRSWRPALVSWPRQLPRVPVGPAVA